MYNNYNDGRKTNLINIKTAGEALPLRRQKVRIKICGLRRMEDIDYVNEVRPDCAGFILASGRRRTITPLEMRELSAHLVPGIKRVAVFVDQEISWIGKIAQDDYIDVIQLHGHEDEDDIAFLRKLTDKMIMKAFRIDSMNDVEKAMASSADMILLDHGGGGTGEAFDWSYITAVKRPFFLAGGLNDKNVVEAVRLTRPWGVDVSSGVETGYFKDLEKIRAFVKAVRAENDQMSVGESNS